MEIFIENILRIPINQEHEWSGWIWIRNFGSLQNRKLHLYSVVSNVNCLVIMFSSFCNFTGTRSLQQLLLQVAMLLIDTFISNGICVSHQSGKLRSTCPLRSNSCTKNTTYGDGKISIVFYLEFQDLIWNVYVYFFRKYASKDGELFTIIDGDGKNSQLDNMKKQIKTTNGFPLLFKGIDDRFDASHQEMLREVKISLWKRKL